MNRRLAHPDLRHAQAAADLDLAISRGDYDLTGQSPRSFRDFARDA
jgi:hypothetical protein